MTNVTFRHWWLIAPLLRATRKLRLISLSAFDHARETAYMRPY
jgi:hypothetical protein